MLKSKKAGTKVRQDGLINKIPYHWALLVGVLSIAAQLAIYYARFGRINTSAPISNFIFFFLAGSLGGWILIEFMNRQDTSAQRWAVLAGFLLGSPFALLLMIGGGLLGPIGVLVAPQIPWALFTWIGSGAARLVRRG